MNFQSFIREQLLEGIKSKQALTEDHDSLVAITQAAEKMTATLKSGGKILLAGNGGSAADAQHIAAEFVSRFYFDRPALSAIALTTDTSILTAIGNDYGFESLFSRQIEALGRKDDIFIAISTSGNSKNILAALKTAREKGLYCVGLTGKSGGAMRDLCDVCIAVPSESTPYIQEMHIMLGHATCAAIEAHFFKN